MQKYHPNISLLALFFITGIILFSCSNKDGNKKQNNEIEVASSEKNQNNKSKQIPPPLPPSKGDNSERSEKTIEINSEEVATKRTTSNKNNSDHSSIASNKDQAKSIKPEESFSNKEKVTNNNTSKKEVASKGEIPLNKNAELPGGIDQFYTFFENEYKRPENTSKLNIKISFAVEKNGSVSYLASEPAVDKTVETEIIRVLSLSPKWQPGESNGKKIKMQYSLPIVLQ
ncbi:hypothetical protein [Flavobacterium piscis]|uniref:TonB C-terminal domain-containing protein n=1 Tax=Flavobacterium piscis TaxID=1114874 RepID=A0ABU1Y1S6_9FLAO|nr:hypothetical protein [Flavobacterium piscis]MDR7208178.1 hypothetical protein [Flavobacterium piscis]